MKWLFFFLSLVVFLVVPVCDAGLEESRDKLGMPSVLQRNYAAQVGLYQLNPHLRKYRHNGMDKRVPVNTSVVMFDGTVKWFTDAKGLSNLVEEWFCSLKQLRQQVMVDSLRVAVAQLKATSLEADISSLLDKNSDLLSQIVHLKRWRIGLWVGVVVLALLCLWLVVRQYGQVRPIV